MGNKPREMDANGRVRCPLCGEWKHVTQFNKNALLTYGISSRCKECNKKYNKRYNKPAAAKKYTLEEARQILALLEYVPERVEPPEADAGEAHPLLNDEDVKFVDGKWCKVQPLTEDDIAERLQKMEHERTNAVRRPSRIELPPNVAPEEHGTYLSYREKLSKRTLEQVIKGYKGDAGLGSWAMAVEDGGEPRNKWSLWQMAVYDEVESRTGAAPEDNGGGEPAAS